MQSKAKQQVLAFIDSLIDEGQRLSESRSAKYPRMTDIVAEPPRQNWIPRIRTLAHLLGRKAAPWKYALDRVPTDSLVGTVNEFLGVLRAIREAVESGLLIQVEDLVLAETIGDLLEQADHLADNGYHLAAGVLGRATLEEHLRNLCDRFGCLPPGRPTINDLNQALYRRQDLDKMEMQQVSALAATGNHCAHNAQPPLDGDRIKTYLRDVREFIIRHPIG
jgi:hypothetical protein